MIFPFILHVYLDENLDIKAYEKYCQYSSIHGCSKIVLHGIGIDFLKLEEVLQVNHACKINTDIAIDESDEFLQNDMLKGYFGIIDKIQYQFRIIGQMPDINKLLSGCRKFGISICANLNMDTIEYKQICQMRKHLNDLKYIDKIFIYDSTVKSFEINSKEVLIRNDKMVYGILEKSGFVKDIYNNNVIIDIENCILKERSL
jgi:hypothetical protein